MNSNLLAVVIYPLLTVAIIIHIHINLIHTLVVSVMSFIEESPYHIQWIVQQEYLCPHLPLLLIHLILNRPLLIYGEVAKEHFLGVDDMMMMLDNRLTLFLDRKELLVVATQLQLGGTPECLRVEMVLRLVVLGW